MSIRLKFYESISWEFENEVSTKSISPDPPVQITFKNLLEKIIIMKSQFTFTLSGILILISLGGCASGDTVYVEREGWGFRHRPVVIYEPPDGPDVVQTPLGPEYLQPPPQ